MDADWRLLETFVRVADRGSLTAAAREMGVSQPTASRHIQALEEQLGLSLFVRHSRGLTLTDRGAELLGSAREVDERVKELIRRVGGTAEIPAGSVRVSANEPLGANALMPAFAALRYRHPQIQIELLIDNSVSNLSQREADVAVRMFRPTQLDLVARHLGQVSIGMYAHVDYLQRHGEPKGLQNMAEHTLIGMDRDPAFARLIAELGMTHRHFALRCDNILAQWNAVLAGVGVGSLHVAVAKHHPELRPVLQDFKMEPLPLWLVMHRDLRGNRAVRAVYDGMAEGLSTYLSA